MKRRTFLSHSTIAWAMLTTAAAGVLVPPRRASAGADPRAAFRAANELDMVDALFGNARVEESERVVVNTPVIGTEEAVPVTVRADIDGIQAMALAVTGNPQPLCALYVPHGSGPGFLATRIALARTSTIVAYVGTGDRVYMARRIVKVSLGGYGTDV